MVLVRILRTLVDASISAIAGSSMTKCISSSISVDIADRFGEVKKDATEGQLTGYAYCSASGLHFVYCLDREMTEGS